MRNRQSTEVQATLGVASFGVASKGQNAFLATPEALAHIWAVAIGETSGEKCSSRGTGEYGGSGAGWKGVDLGRWFSGLGISFSLWAALAAPLRAMEVRLQPENPQLGDTISVTVELDETGSAPTVKVEGETYPAFAIGQNQFRAFVPTTPLDKPGRRVVQVVGSSGERNLAFWLNDRDFPVQNLSFSPGVSDLKVTDYEWDRVTAFKRLVTPQKFWNGPFLKPNAGPVSSVYGVRRYYNGVFAENYYHRGVDYAGSTGSPVVAPAAGRVALVGYVSDGFELHGNTIGIDHGQGVTTIYMHLSRIDVREGDMVQPGQVIGAVGTTGLSTGPHLHWGLYVHGESVDPVPWRYEAIP